MYLIFMLAWITKIKLLKTTGVWKHSGKWIPSDCNENSQLFLFYDAIHPHERHIFKIFLFVLLCGAEWGRWLPPQCAGEPARAGAVREEAWLWEDLGCVGGAGSTAVLRGRKHGRPSKPRKDCIFLSAVNFCLLLFHNNVVKIALALAHSDASEPKRASVFKSIFNLFFAAKHDESIRVEAEWLIVVFILVLCC